MARVIGFELSSQNPEKAADFYAEVFDWKVSDPHWGYQSVQTGTKEEPGIDGGVAKGPHDHPHGTRIQIEVESIAEVISKAEDQGAMIVRDKMEFEDFYLAYLVDPTGVGFGIIQMKRRER